MNVPTKAINAIKQLYKNPTFKVCMEGHESGWIRQETGIRQGCPLSPYLFLILMTCLFHDVHKNDRLKTIEHRIKGMEEDEILYADDTICMSEDEETMNIILNEIEKEGATSRLKLNKTKCEHMNFGQAGRVKFADGTLVPLMSEVKYVGCNLNNRGDPAREISRIIADCMATFNKLHIFLYSSDNTTERKIQMFNAILRAKVMYGLETLVMNTAIKNKLDVFQLKCMRKILQLPTTYINRSYTNEHIRTQISNKLKDSNRKPLTTLSTYHQRMRIKHLQQLIIEGNAEPGAAVTFDIVTFKPIDHGKKRVGQPRLNWYKETMADLWKETKANTPELRFVSALDIE